MTRACKRPPGFLPPWVGKCYGFTLAPPPPVDADLIALLNQPANPLPVLDEVLKAASNSGLLIALAALAGIYLWLKSPQRLLGTILLALAIAASDVVSVRVIKPMVDRPRPCRVDPFRVRHPLGCGSGASFPSAHASNTAAAAVIFAWGAPRLSFLGIALSLLVGISRVYVGAHWPTDVMAGWALGAVLGAILIGLSRLRYLR